MKSALAIIAVFWLATTAGSVHAQPASFEAAPAAAPAAAVATDDLNVNGMLKSCDLQLRACETAKDLCEKDATGVTFLGAAYIALWLILMAFFFVVRARQRRLLVEMKTLRDRLAKLQGGV